MFVDNNYQNLVKKVLDEGYLYDDPNRKGVQRLEIPSYTFRHDFKHGFPAITLKKLAWKSVVTECLWFLRGDTNIKYLIDNGCNIWNKDAYNYYVKLCNKQGIRYNSFQVFKDILTGSIKYTVTIYKPENYEFGDLGKVYSHYWRDFNDVDQIKELIHDMINKPMSSELLVVARDPSHKDEQALPCCHYGFQIVMRPLSEVEISTMIEEKLIQYYHLNFEHHENIREEIKAELPKYGFELHWKQRSCDLFLGIPFNIASYALLALILEKITGHKALGIQGDLKKVHLYDNSVEAAKELIQRECSNEKVLLEQSIFTESLEDVDINNINVNEIIKILDEIKEDIVLINYNPQPSLKVEMLSRT